MKIKIGIRQKIIGIICTLIAIASIVLVYVGYHAFYNTYINFYYEKALGIVKMLAAEVNGDKIEHYVETRKTDEDYLKIQKHFNIAKENVEGINYLYLMKPYDDHFVYVLEAYTQKDNMENIANLGQEFYYGETEKKYLIPDIKNKTATTQIVFGEDNGLGKTISVWAPVFNKDGEVAAMVEADYILYDVEKSINSYVMRVILVMIFAEIIIMLIMVNVINKKVINPILLLTKYVKSYENGEISQKKIHLKEENEIKHLADSFYEMTEKMRLYIEDIERVTAEKERIGAELNIATQIQADMLPCIFPPFPGRTEMDLYASMMPAKEVGGDFYDFFLIDDDHLGLVMADVSGKGVPAALFMVIAKTLIKNRLVLCSSPKETLESVNNQLCENNEAEMFVTAWVGVYEISTGIITASNAGHEYPAIRRADGEFELFKDKHGFVLGGIEDMSYDEYTLHFQEGDEIFLYTDGVPEATSTSKELFGTDRMLAALNKYKDAQLKEMLLGVRTKIDEFAGMAPQFDDITMLALQINEVKEGKQV